MIQPAIDFVPEIERPQFPTRILEDAKTGLLLFGAAFRGRNDGVWFAEAGLRTTCVDIVPERLRAMRPLYPASWHFIEADAFEFAVDSIAWFDVVSVDPPTSLSARCLEERHLWLGVCERALALGLQYETLRRAGIETREQEALDRAFGTPGFRVTELHPRNERSLWLVMERR